MTQLLLRAGEELAAPPRNYQRSNRVFKEKNGWFFHTREGTKAGPYDSMDEAEQAVSDFVTFLQTADWQMRLRYLASISEPVELGKLN